jgi:hypothetical protein
MRIPSSLFVLAALAPVACEKDYVYVPATNTGADVAGIPASDVAIPPESPRGDVRVATFGISDIEPQGAPEGGRVRALHLRMIVANNDQRPWTVDTREQRLALEGRGESRAAYASADAGTPPPLVTVPAGGKRTIDLFFPLPADMEKASELPQFDAIWTVHSDARPVTERIPFERLQVEPPSAYAYDWGYWGAPPYWYDPSYPYGAWVGVALPPVYVERPVVIHRPPVSAPPARRVR